MLRCCGFLSSKDKPGPFLTLVCLLQKLKAKNTKKFKKQVDMIEYHP